MEINEMTEHQAKRLLNQLINKLDVLDHQYFFGTLGWRKILNIEGVPEAINIPKSKQEV
jgi:hypothetical protein